jgi:hypothetical protein
MTENQNKGSTQKTINTVTSLLIVASMVVGATLWISTHVASLRVVIGHHDRDIVKLTRFMEKGDRFTQQDGQQLYRRVTELEQWTRRAPPMWFREMFNDFRDTVTQDVKDMGKQLNNLSLEIESLKLKINALQKIKDEKKD